MHDLKYRYSVKNEKVLILIGSFLWLLLKSPSLKGKVKIVANLSMENRLKGLEAS